MDDEPKRRPSRKAKDKALGIISKASGTKRRSNAPHPRAGHPPKIPKLSRYTTPTLKNKDAEDVPAQYKQTPAHKRMSAHCGLAERERKISAPDVETQIAARARGVTRKNVPLDTFRSIYLCCFDNAEDQQMLSTESVRKIGQGSWREKAFWDRLRKVLSDKVLSDLKLFYSGTKTLPDVDIGKEVASKPDFLLYTKKSPTWWDVESPTWAHVELLIEHTEETEAVTKKFSQWLRCASSVFHHQPFRRYLYGIMFLRPYAYICYADHGCAVYSEPLDFVKNAQHTQFLIKFLSDFITEPEHRGRDPTVKEEYDKAYIQHAGKWWLEMPNGLLCYRPDLVGRHLRVAWVEYQGVKPPWQRPDYPYPQPPGERVVMKSTWEEMLPENPSPPPEVDVLSILLNAGVRGIPQPYNLESAIVRGDGNLEVQTCGFPEKCKVALQARTEKRLEEMESSYVSGRASKSSTPSATVRLSGQHLLDEAKFRRKFDRDNFNKPLEVRRRLTRVMMSYCEPLKTAMRGEGPKTLMQIIRDSMIVYYEAYKRPESGFIHGDISIENILVPKERSKLTGGLTYKDRRGTLIDWNLCFTADGSSSTRCFRSGTAAFMAPCLLGKKPIARRTLAHDMESFFAVIIWIASLDYEYKEAFQAKPLVQVLADNARAPIDIFNAKVAWFQNLSTFMEQIVSYFERPYHQDEEFLLCLIRLCSILYPAPNVDEKALLAKIKRRNNKSNEEERDKDDENNSTEMEDADRMKEGLFRTCMKVIDDYLGDEKGSDEIQWIDGNASTLDSRLGES